MSSWAREIRRIGNCGLALFFPRACDLCGGSVEEMADGAACGACWETTELAAPDDRICWKCGTASDVAGSVKDPRAVRCRHCDENLFSAARALGPYAGALRASVLALKRKPEVGARLLQLLTALAASEPLRNATAIIPIPLHPERERERGFNQAAALAEAIAYRMKLPLDQTSLVRTKHTARHRAEVDARARKASVAGVFQVVHPRRVRDRSILLVDDVLTTGATLSACAGVLREAGATEVFALTIARAR